MYYAERMRPRIHSSLSFLIITAGLLSLETAFGMQSFLDVPVGHRAFDAFQDLSARDILQGYDDGTAKPEKLVNRAEAAKIIVKPVTFDDQLKENFTQDYDDVSSAVWYFPYVARAFHILKIIDGPPQTTVFHGERTVIRAELLKMMLLANNADITLDNDIHLPIAIDVNNPDEWFYPYMRFALSAGMITPQDDGLLHPEKELTREDTALLLYNFYRYREKKGNQELVSRAENAIFYILNALAEEDLDSAEISATQALLSARGTLRSSIPNFSHRKHTSDF